MRTFGNPLVPAVAVLALVLAALLAVIVPSQVRAAPVPHTLQVQGGLRTAGGGPVADGKYTLTIRLYATPTQQKADWQEIHVAVPLVGGAFVADLGAEDPDKNPLPMDLFVKAEGSGPWIGLTVDGDPELPRAPFHASAYALVAERAAVATALAGPIGADQIAPGAVTSEKVGFTYAGSDAKGGAATTALYATSAGDAKTALASDAAKTASSADSAKLALALDCTGCVTAAMLAASVPDDLGLAKTAALHKVALSGEYADLKGGPDLSPFAKLSDANMFAKAQTFSAGYALGGDALFNKQQAKLLRVDNSDGAPATCDAAMEGGLYYDVKKKRFFGCNGASWLAISAGSNSQDNPSTTCKALLASGEGKTSGLYWLQPVAGGPVFQAWCEQTKAGGGWTLVLHVHGHTGMTENKFIAAVGHNRFTDASWNLSGGAIVTGGNAKAPQPGQVTGALNIALFDKAWTDVRMACSQSTGDLTEQAYGIVPAFSTANGNFKLLGAAASGKSYTVDKTTNSQGNTSIWVDNELDTQNGGHYLCDTTNTGPNGTSQFSLCYTDFLNNDNSSDMGDAVVALAFGASYGDDGWSAGFTGECGPMGGNALLDAGTYSIWVR